MCPIIINDDEINQAEKDILGVDTKFNEEQRVFIKCLDSCTLQAYAGTGKTSTIVGKLHALAQKRIWSNGKGVCILSHTNVAVDEIKNHVGKHYPEALEYPNFIGTIQEFVNKYLFIPYLSSNGLNLKFQADEFSYKPDYKLLNTLDKDVKSAINQLKFTYDEKLSQIYLHTEIPIFSGSKLTLDLINRNRRLNKITVEGLNQINEYFKKIIEKRRMNGQFLFCESFIDSINYLSKNPLIIDIIANRFQITLLDEAQDCSDIQLNILNSLFSGKTIFQQVGDINQAINQSRTGSPWQAPEPRIYLTKSMRFGENMAGFLSSLIENCDAGELHGKTNNTIKLLFVYPEGKENDVLERFSEEIETRNLFRNNNIFYAISYMNENILNFLPSYNKALSNNTRRIKHYNFKTDYNYLATITKEMVLKHGSNYIFNLLIHLLLNHTSSSINTTSKLKSYIQDNHLDIFHSLVIKMSKEIIQTGKLQNVTEIQDNLNTIIGETKIDFSNNALDDSPQEPNKIKFNIYESTKGIKINVSTIHGVKGQTHSATLLFSYKAEKKLDLCHAFGIPTSTPKLTPRFKKLIYVATSRSKDLLAIAVTSNEYNLMKDNIYFAEFEVVDIKSP